MTWKDDGHGKLFRSHWVRLSLGDVTWKDALALGSGRIRATTYSVRDVDSVAADLGGRTGELVVDDRHSDEAAALAGRVNPGLVIRHNEGRVHSKILLIEPDIVHVSSANPGSPGLFEVSATVVSREAHDAYVTEYFKSGTPSGLPSTAPGAGGIRVTELKLYYRTHRLCMKLSQLHRQQGVVRAATYCLVNLDEAIQAFERRPKGVRILVNSRFVDHARQLKRRLPDLEVRVSDTVHAKFVSIEPDTLYVGSENLGTGGSWDVMLGIRSAPLTSQATAAFDEQWERGQEVR